ncbi:hypothetical protein [Acidaminobacter hydrogenoformans]|uniref:Uncharacterized protein n=1 Tax=Acidaminobacter hydrogenoformans DSM 2784 TaxID=1120920 RepID=A0A1G5S023_9FIRM|nr:hypothetical protein [Acidaminobacter hydrogenoformans]SCZ79722.1 hypothetical protein SAMN03080599_01917 [Acidaminobacter hydrogenoformans DSM 2784]
MSPKKPRKKRRFLSLFLTIILLFLILLLFGDRLGLGTGNYLSLISSGPEAPAEQPAEPSAETDAPAPGTETPGTEIQEVEITISETTIQIGAETYTLEDFAGFLEETDSKTLFVLSDQQANYALFKEVEALLKAQNRPYVIEE